jgi:glycosyltransferase involved in cell wall biosynthesis
MAQAGCRLVGYVEHATRRLVEGWLDATASLEVALYIDGVERLRAVPTRPRPDAVALGWTAAKGFHFHPTACRLAPGLHVVEVVPLVDGTPGDALPGVGIPDTAFELDIPVPNLADPGLFDYLLREHGAHPEVRRLLIADGRVRYRPERWSGDAIFVDGLPDSPSSRYRIGNIQDELVGLGFDCCTLTEDEVWRIEQGDYSARVVHFFRTPMSGAFATAAAQARAGGARIGFDIDDLAFDPAIMPYIDGLRELSSDSIERYRITMMELRQFAAFADFVTTSTEFLADRIRGIAESVSVVPNSIARGLFNEAYGQAPRRADHVRIGYYAGTRTHQADFAAAADVLVRVLCGYPRLRLRIVGEFNLGEFPRLAAFAERIEQIGLLEYADMLRDMAKCDITIAPLEADNPYCEAKSELKYFEAALTGSVVVASPTAPFRAAIENGRTGFLARSTAEWFRAFVRLLDDPDLMAGVNAEARTDVRRRYHSMVAATRFAEVAQLLPAVDSRTRPPVAPCSPRRADTRFDIGFVVPPLMVGSGGQRKVLRICYDLEQMGHAVSIYVTGARSPNECRELITQHYYPFAGRLFRYNGAIAPHDFLVATAWETAYVVRRHAAVAGEPVYFVQDFEPLFMPMGSGYLKALATYMFGFRTVCLGGWVAERLRREFGSAPATIPFTLDRALYRPVPGARRKNPSVVLFARHSQERRAFALAAEALALVAQRAPEVQIGLFGEAEYPPQRFSFAHHGLIQSGAELAELYRASTVGMCLSPTNPSMVAYEMLACGTPLVDLALPGSAVNFDGMDAAYLAAPTPEDLAAQVLLALQDDALRSRRIRAGIELTSRMESDEAMAVRFDAFLRASHQQRMDVAADTTALSRPVKRRGRHQSSVRRIAIATSLPVSQ